MASSSSSLIVLFLLLFESFTVYSSPTSTRNSASSPLSASKMSPLSLVLPLRSQKVSALSLPRSPNKLLFRHNVSLTVTLSVGTPPQNVSMVLDTGSELSWLLCNSSAASSGGAAINPFFNQCRSSSYSPVPCSSPTCTDRARDLPIPANCDASASHLCHVSLSYADASNSDGTLAAESFVIGSSPRLPTVFGCMGSAYSAAAGDPDVAGLLGMNRGELSFVTQTATRRFSYCIASGRDSSGVLLIGDANLTFIVPLNYTPLIKISLPLPYFDRVAYSVQLEGIRVADAVLPIPKSVLVPDHTGAGQTMVDSGTQFTFLLGPAYDALKTEFTRRTGGLLVPLDEPDFVFEGAFDACFRIPAWRAAPPEGLPTVALMFGGGAEVRVEGGQRLLYRAAGEERGGGDAVWCLTFGNSDLVPMEAYVIGHHHQQDVWVEYDLENGRVGFAPVQCDLASQKLGVLQ